MVTVKCSFNCMQAQDGLQPGAPKFLEINSESELYCKRKRVLLVFEIPTDKAVKARLLDH